MVSSADGLDGQRHVEPAFPTFDPKSRSRTGLPVEVPVVYWAWESHHSMMNQIGGAYFPAPALCRDLNLVSGGRSVDLHDGRGQASLFTLGPSEESGASSHFLFLREDLLNRYLAATGQRLLWFAWGERDFKTAFLLAHADTWSKEFQSFVNIHRGAYVWDPSSHAPVPLGAPNDASDR